MATIETNLNQSPYFDDFNEGKHFHRVLFRPGYAVQARELTPLPTLFQNQIERFGDAILDNGTVINGCDLELQNWQYVKLNDRANNHLILLNEFFDGEMVYRAAPDGSYSKGFEEGISTGTSNLDEFVGIKKNVKQDFASGGLAAMLGE